LQASTLGPWLEELHKVTLPAKRAIDAVRDELTEVARELSPGGLEPVCGVPRGNNHQAAVDLAREVLCRAYRACRRDYVVTHGTDGDLEDLPVVDEVDFAEALTVDNVGAFCEAMASIDPAAVEALPLRIEHEYDVACRNRPPGRRRKGGGKGSKGKRGAYKTDYDPKDDERLHNDWKAAKREGMRIIAEFARARGLDEDDVRAALERHRKRR
jgi:hypothetical protein